MRGAALLLGLALGLGSTALPAAEPSPIDLLTTTSLTVSEKRSQLQALANARPDSGEAWAAYGEVLEQDGDLAAALLAYEKATTVEPALFSPWFRLGLLLKRGVPEKDLPRAEAAFRRALEAGAPKARTLNELAVTMALQGRNADAIKAWQDALVEDPGWGALHANIIKAALREGKESLVRTTFEEGLKAERFEDTTALHWGEFLAGKGRLKEAQEAYQRALQAQPLRPRLRYYHGLVLEKLKRPDEALTELRTARQLAEQQDAGSDLIESADWACFRVSHPKDEAEFQRTRDLVYRPAPDARKLQDNLQRALAILDPLLQRHPEFWNGFFVRGVAHRRLNNVEKARADLQKVLELRPREPNASMEMALLLRDEHSFDAAADLAEGVLERVRKDPLMAMNAGFIFIEAKRCDRAWEAYDVATRLAGAENTVPLRDELDLRCPRPN